MRDPRTVIISGFLNATGEPLRRTARFIGRYTRNFPAADSWLARPSAVLVNAYRTFLSPYKGYNCAHAGAGRLSCSDVAETAFTDLPFSAAIKQIEVQFDRCRSAFISLQSDLIDQALNHLPRLGDHVNVSFLACNGNAGCCGGPPPAPPPP